MANYLLLYHGGTIANSDEEKNTMMAAWGQWMDQVGENLVDGGNPTANAKNISQDKAANIAGDHVTGYSIVAAGSMDEAVKCAQMVPVVAEGGSVDVYEIHPAM